MLKILDTVSSSGRGAAIAASSLRGSTLRGNKVSNLYDYFKYIFLTIPGILGSPSYTSEVLKTLHKDLEAFMSEFGK